MPIPDYREWQGGGPKVFEVRFARPGSDEKNMEPGEQEKVCKSVLETLAHRDDWLGVVHMDGEAVLGVEIQFAPRWETGEKDNP